MDVSLITDSGHCTVAYTRKSGEACLTNTKSSGRSWRSSARRYGRKTGKDKFFKGQEEMVKEVLDAHITDPAFAGDGAV